MLCDTCRNIKFRRPAELSEQPYKIEFSSADLSRSSEDREDLYAHWVCFHLLRSDAADSARRGCHLCNFLLECLLRNDYQETEDSWARESVSDYEGIVLCLPHPNRNTQNLINLDIYCGKIKASAHLDELPDVLAQISDFGSETPQDDFYTGSQNNLNLARFWMDECEQHHGGCMSEAQIEGETVLPDYVVDTQKLCLVKGDGHRARYATLSYCWGSQPQPERTTTKNLESQLERIKVMELPQTLQDAIYTVRELDIRYLWIDSLCIIQDSEEHWDEQSRLMGNIYQNAVVNISAAAGSAADDGCFVMRNPLAVRPCRIPQGAFPDRLPEGGFPSPNWMVPEDHSLFLCIMPSQSGVPLDLATSPEIVETRWPSGKVTGKHFDSIFDQRAWILQEQMLSERMLRFNAAGMSWRCRLKDLEENSPATDCRYGVPRSGTPPPQRWLGSRREWYEKVDHYNTEGWYDTVKKYNARHLTVATDKLPALSGLATKFNDTAPAADTYLAGLWKHDIACGLLWMPHDTSKGCRSKTSLYVAPSWSWASLDPVRIEFYDRRRNDAGYTPSWRPPFSVIDVKCTPYLGDKHGRLKEASLRVRGWIREARLFTESDPRGTSNSNDQSVMWGEWQGLIDAESGDMLGMVRLDEPIYPNGQILCLPLMERQMKEHFGLYKYLDIIYDRRKEIEKLFDTRAVIRRKKRGWCYGRYGGMPEYYVYRCLALVKNQSDECVRVGVADLWDLDWFTDDMLRTITLV